MSKNEILFIILCIATAFLFRIYLFPQNLFFGPEQGVDFLAIKSIVYAHKLTLIGAKTDIRGIFHGPLYYYIASVPFFVSHGNPVVVSAFFIFLQSLTVIPLYLLGRLVYSKRTAVLSVIFFSVSFEAIVSARWLSGQPLEISLICCFLYFLFAYIQRSDKNLMLIALCYGLLAQVEFLNTLFIGFFLLLFALFFYKRIIRTNIFILLSSILIAGVSAVGTLFLFDLRHQFLILKSILNVLMSKGGFSVPFGETLFSTYSIYISVIARALFPLCEWGGLVILVSFFVYLFRKNSSLILLLIFSPVVVLVLVHQSVLEHFLMLLIPVFCLAAGAIVDHILEKRKLLGYGIVLTIFLANIYSIFAYLPDNKNVFFQSTQPFLRYADQTKTIDDIYSETGGEQFAFQAYTIPYWRQEGWDYLFWYFGSSKYHYYPNPITHDKLFVIVQKDPSPFQKVWLQKTVPLWGTLQQKKNFGDIDLLTLQVKQS